MSCRASVLAVVLAVAWPGAVAAHQLDPALLELEELGDQLVQLHWKRGIGGAAVRTLSWASECEVEHRGPEVRVRSAVHQRARLRCRQPVSIEIQGFAAGSPPVVVRHRRSNGELRTALLSQEQRRYSAVAGDWQPAASARSHLVTGIRHIALGIDHLAFLVCLAMLLGWRRSLLWAVTAFTVAHSLSLLLVATGALVVPPGPVEACIALSVVLLASAALCGRIHPADPLGRRPWLAAFAFGLLHGAGFAGALQTTGLSAEAVGWTLLFFNVGVEVGQLAFLLGVFAVAAVAARLLPRRIRPLRIGLLYVIGGAATYWTIERAVGVLT